MYRVLGERAEGAGEEATASKPPLSLRVSRGAGLAPVLGMLCVGGAITVWVFSGTAVAAALTFGIWLLFIVVLTRVILRPRIVVVDYAARRVRCAPHDVAFDSIFFARVDADESERRLSLFGRDQTETTLVRGTAAEVRAVANAINLALAAEYESIRIMPDGLAAAMKELDQGLPLSGFSKLTDFEKRARIESLLRALPVTDLEVHRVYDGALHAVATGASGISITFFYSLRKDRIEVAAATESPHGHLEFVRREEVDEGNGWVPATTEPEAPVLINGEKNRAVFEAFPAALRDRVRHDVPRLRLRGFSIQPKETRAVSRDGLRDLRDPHARVAGMLALVADVASYLEPAR